MKILIGYPPTTSEKGIATLGQNNKKTIALGEIIGTIPGDGFLGLNKNESWDYTLACKDKELVEKIARDFYILFEIKPNIHQRKTGLWCIRISNKKFAIFLDYLEKRNGFWIFTNKTLKSDFILKNSLIRGFADCEGTATCSIQNNAYLSRRIALYNSNKTLLVQLQEMLKEMGIISVIKLDREFRKAVIRNKEYQFREVYSLRITNYHNLKLFNEYIGFNIPRKVIKLREMLNSYKDIDRVYSPEDYKNIMRNYINIRNCRELSRRFNTPHKLFRIGH